MSADAPTQEAVILDAQRIERCIQRIARQILEDHHAAPLIAIEAAIRQPWDRILGENDAFVGMNDFGASAPAGNLFPHFGITADAVVAAAKIRVA